ncbi:glycosyltransferase family 87 protein [Methylobacterium trifolii]|uniref:DUF2029 domain-containing protein n=1 Tax=Methylobacterium trifolii TaxID=1003092 RepID=A0ABQ4U447_9HYPH|nr:glycosyltransferase family 87 protein [Methylobacterium trifolii]GJE61602.1 hypothetical protein MPOCJGCO_3724 [Methylobacterium trifolii]
MSQPALRSGQVAVVGIGALVSLASWLSVRPWDTAGWMIGAPFGRDFVNFWMAPRLVMAGNGAYLTDLPAYQGAIRTLFGLSLDPALVFVYPPHALLFLAPFALLPFLPAVCAWTALNLAALTGALRACDTGRSLPRGLLTLLVCLSPPAVAMIVYGHFGGLIALAATLAVVEGQRRPWLAGFCLACLTVKPQLACVLGLILLCGGYWRCLFASGVFTVALVGLSVAAFGVEPWQRFVTVTMPMQSAFVTAFDARWIQTSISVYFSARFWDLPAALAWTIQGSVAAVAFAGAVTALRRGRPDPTRLLVILLAAIVILPYASHYELAVVAPVLTLVVLDRAVEPAPPPLLVLAWITIPLARILYVFDLPILSFVVAGGLFALSRRLLADGWLAPAPMDRPARA